MSSKVKVVGDFDRVSAPGNGVDVDFDVQGSRIVSAETIVVWVHADSQPVTVTLMAWNKEEADYLPIEDAEGVSASAGKWKGIEHTGGLPGPLRVRVTTGGTGPDNLDCKVAIVET